MFYCSSHSVRKDKLQTMSLPLGTISVQMEEEEEYDSYLSVRLLIDRCQSIVSQESGDVCI